MLCKLCSKGFNQELFDESFNFLSTQPNLRPILLRQKEDIEKFVRDSVASMEKVDFSPLGKYIEEVFEKESNKSADVQIAAREAWIEILFNEREKIYQDVATHMACILQAELAFLRGWTLSMINKDGKLADFGKAVDMEKFIEKIEKTRQAEKDDPESFRG